MTCREELISREYQEKLLANTFKLNTKLLTLCGLVPSPTIRSTPWKYALFRAYTCFSLLVIFSGFITTFLAMLEHWDDIERTGESAFVCISFALVLIGSIFILLSWEKLQILMCSTEHEFLSNIQKTYVKHLHESKKFSKSLTRFLFLASVSITVGRGYLPFATHYVRKYVLSAEDMNRHSINLLFDMWLPFQIDEAPSLLGTYIIQVFIQFVSVTHHISVITYFFALFIYACSRFKVLISALDEIDSFISHTEIIDLNNDSLVLKNDNVHEFNDSHFTTSSKSAIQDQALCTGSNASVKKIDIQKATENFHQIPRDTQEKFEANLDNIYSSDTNNDITHINEINLPNIIMLRSLYTQEDRLQASIIKSWESTSVSMSQNGTETGCIDKNYEIVCQCSNCLKSVEPKSFRSSQINENRNMNVDDIKLPNITMLKTIYSEKVRERARINQINSIDFHNNGTNSTPNNPYFEDTPHSTAQIQNNNTSERTSLDKYTTNDREENKLQLIDIESTKKKETTVIPRETASIDKTERHKMKNELRLDVELLDNNTVEVERYFIECIREHQDLLRYVTAIMNKTIMLKAFI